MNFSQLGVALNMSRSGARSLVLRNKTKLKKYLIIKNKNVVGITDDNIDEVRNLIQRNTNTTYNREKDIELLKVQLDSQINLCNEKDKLIQVLQKSIDDYKFNNEQLKSELEYYRSLGFFQRLLGYHKK